MEFFLRYANILLPQTLSNIFTKIDKSVYFADRKTQKVFTNTEPPDPIHGMYRDIVFNV